MDLLSLQPPDQIRQQCMILDNKTLSRFTQTNKRIYDICRDILHTRKIEEYNKQKNELLKLFDVKQEILTDTFLTNNFDNNFITIGPSFEFHDDSIKITIPRNKSVLSDFLDGIYFDDTHSISSIVYTIPKSVLSDELKLEFLRLAKKIGYTTVHTNEFSPDTYTRIIKSLDNFYILD